MKALLKEASLSNLWLPLGLFLLPGGSVLTLLLWFHQWKQRQGG